MNAQEAIVRLEKEIEHIESLIDERNNLEFAGYISEEQRMKDEEEYNKDKEALSIVLESAKLLHRLMGKFEDGIYKEYKRYIVFLRNTGYDGALYMSEKELKAIGIEKGADS